MEPVKALILKHLRGQLTPEEAKELDVWLAAAEANQELFAELNDPDRVAVSLGKFDQLHENQVWERLQRHAAAEEDTPLQTTPPAHRVHFLRRWSVAVAVVGLLGTGA